jgi:hypothetical protein
LIKQRDEQLQRLIAVTNEREYAAMHLHQRTRLAVPLPLYGNDTSVVVRRHSSEDKCAGVPAWSAIDHSTQATWHEHVRAPERAAASGTKRAKIHNAFSRNSVPLNISYMCNAQMWALLRMLKNEWTCGNELCSSTSTFNGMENESCSRDCMKGHPCKYDRHPRPSALKTFACGLLDDTVMAGAAHATRHSVVVKDAKLGRTLRRHFEELPYEWRLRVSRHVDFLQFDMEPMEPMEWIRRGADGGGEG